MIKKNEYNIYSFSHKKNSSCTSFIGDVAKIESIEKVYKKIHFDVTMVLYGLKSIGGSIDISNYSLNEIGGMINILNCCDRGTEKNIMEWLDIENQQMAQEVRDLMFVFEDIMILDDRSIQRLLREVETKVLALALKGTKDEIKEKIFKNMSERAQQMLKDDMEYLGPVRAKEVQEAQTQVVNAIRTLEATGEITITRASIEDELIE